MRPEEPGSSGRTRVSADGREVAALVRALPTGRFVLGISGSPGAGKSTLAAALAVAYGVPVVPMDGFHRPHAELVAMGRLDAKGAPDTFDAEAYAALLHRLHVAEAPGGDKVLAPAFDHASPDPVPDAIEVPATAGLVVTEGNYLLLDEPRWHAARRECDAVWHVVTDEAARIERLVRRHNDSGKPPDQAREWVARVDQPNAELVEAAAAAADLMLDVSAWAGGLPSGRAG